MTKTATNLVAEGTQNCGNRYYKMTRDT